MAEAKQQLWESSDVGPGDGSGSLAEIWGWEEAAKQGQGKLSRHWGDLPWEWGWEPEETRIRGNCCSWRCCSS